MVTAGWIAMHEYLLSMKVYVCVCVTDFWPDHKFTQLLVPVSSGQGQLQP